MSIRGNGPLMGASHGHDTQPDYYPITYASSAFELASHRASPLALGTNGFARYGQRVDRALFPAIRSALKPAQLREALLNVLLIGGAIGLIVTVAAAALIAPYILFFMET